MKGLAKLTANLQKLATLADPDVLLSGAAVLLEAIKANAPVDTGNLRDGYVIVENVDSHSIAIVTDVPYASDVEFGTQPHVRPAIDTEQDNVGKAIAEVLRDQIGRS